MYEYARPSLTRTESSIVKPIVVANFLEIGDTFKVNGATNNVIRLRLFPFSLRN